MEQDFYLSSDEIVESIKRERLSIYDVDPKNITLDKDQNYASLLIKDDLAMDISDSASSDSDNTSNSSEQSIELPSKIIKLADDLTELEIYNVNCRELPECTLKRLPIDLKKLYVHHTSIALLPTKISHMLHLRVLDLSYNKLEDIPDSFESLTNLKSLNLKYNQLKDLPKSLRKLQRLKELDISGNKFTQMPHCVQYGMGTLITLNVSHNKGMNVHISPYSRYIEKFYANSNGKCFSFPDWTLKNKYFALKEINLDDTQFDVYNFEGQGNNLSIDNISMKNSNLSSAVLNMIVENMTKIKVLKIGNNQSSCSIVNIFNSIPITTLKSPANLIDLDVSATSLPMIPKEIIKLENLVKVDFSFNCISWIPDEFCELQKLEYLSISGNKMILLPKNIGNLKLLKVLKSSNNDIRQLPESFKTLTNLEIVDFYENNFEEFPAVLSCLPHLKGLDFEQNCFSTNELMVGEDSYMNLRNAYISAAKQSDSSIGDRKIGLKNSPYDYSDDESDNSKDSMDDYYFQEHHHSENIMYLKTSDSDECWDTKTDSADEFEPAIAMKEVNYNVLSRKQQWIVGEGFCPADLHVKTIKSQVSCMRKYGSIPAHSIEEGQFDDD
ncbi:leucine-rich repeat and death domain-containing protein 1-like [Trichogramma pretiosum]|uniref:leucine-rich repeat and death domain-containing protein 1-like n=1 Tax=Trichogramma pretiosum TaxID=7493 RepID=UPI0006C9B721|nr:leucine-rich repeat and death domain-containing protein 1-like [Trichogramma pretiosum]